VIDRLADTGLPVDRCCRVLGVSRQGYYRYKRRPTSATQLRRQWLTGLIREVHIASRGTYGYRRIHAELTMGMKVQVSSRLVWVLMNNANIYGLPGPTRIKRLRGVATADDLVNRKFHRLAPNELWVTDITEHPTREGRVYCAAVMDAYSRRIVGWSIDSRQDSTLVVNALDMAIRNRRPEPGGIVHADHGVQGGLNWSSQHLDDGGVVHGNDERATAAGAVVSGADPIARCADGRVARGSRSVLGGHRPGREDRRGGCRGGRVLPGRVSVVPARWWCEPMPSPDSVGPLPVVL